MDDGTKIRRTKKKAKFIKYYEEQEIVESHDYLHLEESWHVKKILSYG